MTIFIQVLSWAILVYINNDNNKKQAFQVIDKLVFLLFKSLIR